MMKLYNTLTRAKADVTPVTQGEIKLYTCGPTVYHYAHIGNLRKVIVDDTLRRALQGAGYAVNHVMNITDVGHLTSDADAGEDKLEKGARSQGKSVWDVAKFYTQAFQRHTSALNVLEPTKTVPATSEIAAQIELIEVLLDKGLAYQAKQAIYFDVQKSSDYGKLTGQKLVDKGVAVRDEVVADPDKRYHHDFALWFFTVGRFEGHTMKWPSPWGEGFPGWHLECSAIIHAHLGETIDIHTGGVDHIGTHHTNEIAQSEAAYGKPLANIWLHSEFLQLDGAKMAKSGGTGSNLDELIAAGYHPMAFRFLVLTAHYRSQQNFTYDSLDAAGRTLLGLYGWAELRHQSVPEMSSEQATSLERAVATAIEDDLNTPQALAAVQSATGNHAPSLEILVRLDGWLGLDLAKRQDLAPEHKQLIVERELIRETGDWAKSDEFRDQLATVGIELSDTSGQTIWRRASI